MAVETKSITCTPGLYTVLAEGKASVSFRSLASGSGRMVVAASIPSSDTQDFIIVDPNEPVRLAGLGATDNVYFQPVSNQNHVVQVVRG